MTKERAILTLCRLIGEPKNLIGTDFADASAQQDGSGVLIQFTISNHAIGKLGPKGIKGLLGTDVAVVSKQRVRREFIQDKGGVAIQCTISNHVITQRGPKAQETVEILLS